MSGAGGRGVRGGYPPPTTHPASQVPTPIISLPCRHMPAAGKPLFGTLIALLHRGEPVLGIIDQPILKERWVGVAGQRSTLNGQPISTRECGAVGDAYLYATTPHMFAGDTEAAFNRVRDAGERGWREGRSAAAVLSEWEGLPCSRAAHGCRS